MKTNELNHLQPTTNIYIQISPDKAGVTESCISLKKDMELAMQMQATPYSKRPVSAFLRGDILLNQADGKLFQLDKVLTNHNSEVESLRTEERIAVRLAITDGLPVWTPSCQMRYVYHQRRYFINRYTYLMDVDVMRCDNLRRWDGLKRDIAALPQVVYCGDATNGEDFFFVVPILTPQRYEEHAAAIVRRFAAAGVRVRVSPTVAHWRTWSFDSEATINDNAEVFTDFF